FNALSARLPAPDGFPPSVQWTGPAQAIPGSLVDPWELGPGRSRTWADVDGWILPWQAAFEDLREILDGPYCAPVVDYSQGLGTTVPNLAQIKGAAGALAVCVGAAARRGDFEGVRDNLRALSRVGDILDQQPLLISFLVRMA